ncbi:MAG: DNA translocase FtsK [Lachnospiraceae bacterium]|nr:DNA translocase FtsK [Lachnospiraceae bacterium]
MASEKTKSRKTSKRKSNQKMTARASGGKSRSAAPGNAGKRKAGARSSTEAHKQQPKRPAAPVGVVGDIVLLVFLLLAILIFLFNLGIGGPAGNAISDFLFGLFGYVAWIVPFYIFLAIAFYFANRNNPLIVRKTVGLVMLLIFSCALVQLVTVRGFDKSLPISDYYYNSSSSHSDGGFIGGAVVKVFTLGFSIAVAWVLTIFGLAMSLIIFTQKPLLSKLGIKTKLTADGFRAKRMEKGTDEDYEEDLDYEDEEDMASARAMRKSSLRSRFQLFNLKAERNAEEKRNAEDQRKLPEAEEDDEGLSGLDLEDGLPKEKEKAADSPNKAKKTGKKPVKAAKKKSEEQGDPSRMPAFLKGVMASSSKAENSAAKKEAADDAAGGKEEEPIKGGRASAIIIEGTGISDEVHLPKDNPKEDAGSGEKEPSKRKSVKKQKSKEEEIESGVNTISGEISAYDKPEVTYTLPSTDLLTKGKPQAGDSRQHLLETAQKLEQIFRDFGVNVHVNNVSRGPTVTRYELTPEQGVKVSRIVSLSDDIKLNLAASEIRIEAPIPGKAAVGIEVPNKESAVVAFRDLVESPDFVKSKAPMTFAVGKDISGKPVISDIAKMPHLLIAGATGSGKSVCINTLIMSVLMKSTPDEVRMLMIDPKVVELKIYDGIPHLLIPVVTDPKKASGALNWAVREMNDRYNKFAEYTGVRDLKAYNKRVEKINEALPPEERLEKLPQILIIVDELADLMMVAPGEVEDAICRLAQLARAAGLHLVIATQRPSVNVVTGLIKANMPSRIALAVSSGVDSRTIIDMNGAEKLLGHGDMLFAPQGYPKPARVQGAYVSDDDISRVVKYLTRQMSEKEYSKGVEEEITKTINNSSQMKEEKDDGRDEYFVAAGRFIIEKDKASIGMLQRMFKIGFNRAARIMDQLSEAGVVGPEEGTKPRKIMMDAATFEAQFGDDSEEA